jgi:hypothetical protein
MGLKDYRIERLKDWKITNRIFLELRLVTPHINCRLLASITYKATTITDLRNTSYSYLYQPPLPNYILRYEKPPLTAVKGTPITRLPITNSSDIG